MNIRTTTAPTTNPPGEPSWRSWSTVGALVVAVVVAAAAAIVLINANRESGFPSTTRTTGETGPTPVTSPALPPDPQAAAKAAVIAAYTQSFNAIIVVGRQTPANPADPRLSEHTSGPALIAKQRAIADFNAKGLIIVGEAELHPTVVDLTAESATVIECALDRTAEVESRTGRTIIDAGPNEGIASTSKMRLEGGVWKVTDFKNEKRACVPPAA